MVKGSDDINTYIHLHPLLHKSRRLPRTWRADKNEDVMQSGENEEELKPRALKHPLHYMMSPSYTKSFFFNEFSNTLDGGFCIRAWEKALTAGRSVPRIHNTDQGSQFTRGGRRAVAMPRSSSRACASSWDCRPCPCLPCRLHRLLLPCERRGGRRRRGRGHANAVRRRRRRRHPTTTTTTTTTTTGRSATTLASCNKCGTEGVSKSIVRTYV